MLERKKKDRIIAKFRTHEKDTGSPQVQIAILTAEIGALSEHLKQHKKDYSSRRGLLKMVGERKALLQYLSREDWEAAEDLAKKLKIKLPRRGEEKEELSKTKEEQHEETV